MSMKIIYNRESVYGRGPAAGAIQGWYAYQLIGVAVGDVATAAMRDFFESVAADVVRAADRGADET